MKIKIKTIWGVLLFLVIPLIITGEKIKFEKNKNRKSFYIMKVIYNIIIYRLLSIGVRNVQQSLYTGKRKYILKKLEIW